MPELQQIGRLSLRVEGNNWNAYYAMPDTMVDALFLGSIRMALVKRSDRRKEFMGLMRNAVGDIIEETLGKRPEWKEPHAAPEHEKSGSA